MPGLRTPWATQSTCVCHRGAAQTHTLRVETLIWSQIRGTLSNVTLFSRWRRHPWTDVSKLLTVSVSFCLNPLPVGFFTDAAVTLTCCGPFAVPQRRSLSSVGLAVQHEPKRQVKLACALTVLAALLPNNPTTGDLSIH